NEVGVVELEPEPDLIPQVYRLYLQKLIGPPRARIRGQVVVEFPARKPVKTEVADPVALELELERQMHVDGLNRPLHSAVSPRQPIRIAQLLLSKGNGR